MKTLRAIEKLRWVLSTLLLTLPLAAILAAALLQQDLASGHFKVALIPAAVVLLDPFFYDCLSNSALVSAAAALLSVILGVPLARILARSRSVPASLLSVVSFVPALLPPVLSAMGLKNALWLAEPISRSPASLNPAWLLAVWAYSSAGVAIVAFSLATRLRAISPAISEAGLALGASRRTVWRVILWPLVKGSVAKAAIWVFALSLLDPGVPLVLGLRRTSGYQLLEAASGPANAPLLSLVALFGLAAVALLSLLSSRTFGRRHLPVASHYPPTNSGPQFKTSQRVASVALALAILTATLFPCASLALRGLSLTRTSPLPTIARLAQEGLDKSVLTASALIGSAAVLLSLVLVPFSKRDAENPLGDSRLFWTPTILAAGFLLLHQFALASPSGPAPADSNSWSGALALAERLLHPMRGLRLPWIIVLALWLANHSGQKLLLPTVALDPAWHASARALGASQLVIFTRLLLPRLIAPVATALLVGFWLSATEASASLLLIPTSIGCPVGPVLVSLACGPRTSDLAAVAGLPLVLGAVLISALIHYRMSRIRARGRPVGISRAQKIGP